VTPTEAKASPLESRPIAAERRDPGAAVDPTMRDDDGHDEPTADSGGRRVLRVMLVEDMPEMTAHLRELIRAQASLKLVGAVEDGRTVLREIVELRPDVLVVDSLLQVGMTGARVIERLNHAGSTIPVVALEVPDQPLDASHRALVDAVATMPFGTFDLLAAIRRATENRAARDPRSHSRVVAIYAAKGGVGKTTLAYNVAVAMAAAEFRTALIDGSLQYGDLRRHLRVDPAVPSICDLPGEVRVSDLEETMYRDPSGVEVLLAPPRLEMADLVAATDVETVLELARRAYHAVIIDTPSALNETTLAMLDLADVILQVLTPEPAALDSTRAAAAAFAAIGYPTDKVRTVINRADATGGLSMTQLERALGGDPDYVVASDWQLVAASNREGIPFVTARPDAEVSENVVAMARHLATVVGTPGEPRRRARTSAAAG
jgi:pilus assembly protein CpaE